MQLKQISVFQLLTKIESTLKNLQHEQLDPDWLNQIVKELKTIELSSEIIFSQLIPSQLILSSLKFTLLNSISDFIGTDSLFRFQIEKHEKIKMNFNYFPNIDNGSEILRKVSAIKSEIMFVNQELSIQSLDENSDTQIQNNLEKVQLRKLIKEFMRNSRKDSQTQSLTPICIRLVVLLETIMAELEKALTLFQNLLNQDDELLANKINEKQSVMSVSSLSASIEQFLQRKNHENQDDSIDKQMFVSKIGQPQPRIRSSFLFKRVDSKRFLVKNRNFEREKKRCIRFCV